MADVVLFFILYSFLRYFSFPWHLHIAVPRYHIYNIYGNQTQFLLIPAFSLLLFHILLGKTDRSIPFTLLVGSNPFCLGCHRLVF